MTILSGPNGRQFTPCPTRNAQISESVVAGDPIELTAIHCMWNTWLGLVKRGLEWHHAIYCNIYEDVNISNLEIMRYTEYSVSTQQCTYLCSFQVSLCLLGCKVCVSTGMVNRPRHRQG